MARCRSILYFPDRAEELSGQCRTGVSLHCHTHHSHETLEFLPAYAARIPGLSFLCERERALYRKRAGRALPDLSHGYWRPPHDEREVWRSEVEQLDRLGLDALVSITDHDTIAAGLKLNGASDAPVPISFEWTVPFEKAFLRVGVHHLPPERAEALAAKLIDYSTTERPCPRKLHELFAELFSCRETLLVLNHPLCDAARAGAVFHRAVLRHFLEDYGRWIHALEVNGFRSWAENKETAALAENLGLPAVSGGDRHCGQANDVLNLTNARSFAEFTEEIKTDKLSRVALLPGYREPLSLRRLTAFAQFVGEIEGAASDWTERIFFDAADGRGSQPLSAHWGRGGPFWLRAAARTIGFLGRPEMRFATRLAAGGKITVEPRWRRPFRQISSEKERDAAAAAPPTRLRVSEARLSADKKSTEK